MNTRTHEHMISPVYISYFISHTLLRCYTPLILSGRHISLRDDIGLPPSTNIYPSHSHLPLQSCQVDIYLFVMISGFTTAFQLRETPRFAPGRTRGLGNVTHPPT